MVHQGETPRRRNVHDKRRSANHLHCAQHGSTDDAALPADAKPGVEGQTHQTGYLAGRCLGWQCEGHQMLRRRRRFGCVRPERKGHAGGTNNEPLVGMADA
uniref:(northern house mosquito) hypothetical protein n=1 Tax=Culex pipiens TaxID=7175 RepID=A0A8D7ZXX4_CULPI